MRTDILAITDIGGKQIKIIHPLKDPIKRMKWSATNLEKLQHRSYIWNI